MLQTNEMDDFSELIRIFTSENNTLKKNPLPTKSYLETFLRNPRNYILVAIENNKIVGGLTAFEMEMYKNEFSEMFLFEIEVLKNYRQQGVGKSLIQELKNICNQKGIKQIFVVTSRTNYPALKLYETAGGASDNESKLFNFFL